MRKEFIREQEEQIRLEQERMQKRLFEQARMNAGARVEYEEEPVREDPRTFGQNRMSPQFFALLFGEEGEERMGDEQAMQEAIHFIMQTPEYELITFL